MSDALQKRWSVFAWELHDILAAHSLQLSTLHYPGLSEEKLRRLQDSLYSSPDLPVLNPAELAGLKQVLSLSPEEEVRLHAALLAAALQQLLVEHIEREETVQLATQAYETMRANLWAQWERQEIEGTERGGDSEVGENRARDMNWLSVKYELEAGELALQLSQHVSTRRAQMQKAREARAAFEGALFELNRLDNAIKAMCLWLQHYNAARLGLESARQRLRELGAE